MSLSAEEIKDTAKWMMATSDASFWTAIMRFRVFLRDCGLEMNEAQYAEFIGILRGLDEHRITQAEHLMKMAQDCLNLTPNRTIILTSSALRKSRENEHPGDKRGPHLDSVTVDQSEEFAQPAVSLISSVPDEFHDPEPER